MEHRPVKGSKSGGTSYNIFLKYVKCDPFTGKVDVYGMFSKKCFLEWLASRKDSIKQPQVAFKRTLVGHIAAIGHRRPFPEKVEAAALELLRSSNLQPGYETVYGIWTEIFLNAGLKFRKRSFLRKGYHEERRIRKQLEAKKSFKSNSLVRQPMKTSLLQLDPYDALMNLFSCYTPEQIAGLTRQAMARGININDTGIFTSCKVALENKDPRFDISLISIPARERRFDPNRPVGQLVMDESYITLAENQEAIDMLGGSSLGKLTLETSACFPLTFYCAVVYNDQFHATGECWYRNFGRKLDGTLMYLLVRMVRVGNTIIEYTQEIKHPGIMPLFDLPFENDFDQSAYKLLKS